MLKDMTDADLKKLEQKLQNLGVSVDTKHLRPSIEAAIGATPFNATVAFGNARASLDAALTGTSGKVNVEVIASKLHDSINAALDKYTGKTLVVPKKKELRKAVNNALLSAGFEINIGKVKGLTTTISNALGTDHTLKLSVDPKKLADAIDKAVKSYKGGTQIPLEAKEKVLHDSIRKALKSEKFPIKVIVDKAEAQDAVRQALQAAGLQNQGFTTSDKRAWDAQSRRIEAEARAAAASALAQRRLAGAHTTAQRATESHIRSSMSLGTAMRGNIHIAGELGPMLASAYSVVALKNFMQKVVEIGGELEKQKLAMNAILGNEGFANTISSQINSLAVKSPFGVLDLNKYAKQLTAFQIPYNELYDTMKRMADISAATGTDMGRIILAFGQIRSATVLKGTEARQLTEANIPIYQMLSDYYTKLEGQMVSVGEVMDRMSKKEIPFQDVKNVMWELTNEGGRFYNMQEVLSESVQAKWKNLADAIDLMFADIAEDTAKPLKGLAELLTGLTRRWEMIAGAVTSGILAFGGVKTALMLMNRGLANSTVSAIKAAESQAVLERRNLRLAQSYRALTAEEKATLAASSKNVFSGLAPWKTASGLKNLTNEQFKQLTLSQQISKEDWKRLIAMGKVSDMQKLYLVRYGGISAAEIRSIRNLKGMQLLLAKIRFTAASVGRSLAGFFFNPATLITTAVAATAAVIEKNKEEIQRANELGKDMGVQGSEGVRNLKAELEAIPKNLSGAAQTQALEKLQQLIRDYSSIPDTVIDMSKFKDDGTIRSVTDQISYLREELEKLKAANDEISKNGEEYSAVVKSTNGGVFDDDVITDINDWAKAVETAKGAYLKFVTEHKKEAEAIVATAAKEDAAYRESIKNMDRLIDKFSELMSNSEKYSKGFNAAVDGNRWGLNGGFWGAVGLSDGVLSSNIAQSTAYNEMISEIKQAAKAFKELYSDWDWDNLDSTQEEIIRKYFNGLIQKAEDAGPEAQKQLQSIISNILNFDISGMSGELMIVNEMRDKLPQLLGKELADKVVNGLQLTNDEQSKVDKAIQDTYFKMFANADTLGKKALTKAVSKDGKVIDLTKLAGIRARFDVTADWDSWKRELNQLFNGDLTIQAWLKGVTDIPSFIKAAQEGYSNAQKTIDKFKGLKLSASIGFDFENLKAIPLVSKQFADASPIAKQMIIEWNKAVDIINGAKKSGKELGFDPAAEYNKGHKGSKGSQKDEFAEAIKERINLLKKAKSEYESLAKLVGRESASKQLADSPIFAGLKANKFLPEQTIPKTLDDYEKALDELQETLTSKGLKTKKHRELNVEIEQVKFDINKKRTEEQLKLTLDKVSKEAERQLADWNLFDKIRKATGNQDLAMSIAFGVNADATTDYPALVKKQFNDLAKTLDHDITFDNTTLEQARKLGDDIAKSYQDTADKLDKYTREQKDTIADILNEYQSLQDKLAQIDADRQRKIDTVNRSTMSDPQKAQLTQRINVEADYKKFTQSNEYLQFFAGIYGLTQQEAQRIGDLIEQNLNNRLQAGTISAEDYYKEIERIRQQLDKLRNVKSDALTYLTGGVKGLTDKRMGANDAARLQTIQKIKGIEEELAKAQASGDQYAISAAEAQLEKANEELLVLDKIRDKLIQNQQEWQNVLDIANIVAGISNGLSDAFGSIREMADAFGVDTESGAWLDVGGVLDSLNAVTGGVSKIIQSAMNGDIGGILGGVVNTITSPFTIWAQIHDKKLQKMIERSQQAAQIMQNQYDILEKRMANWLGNAADMNTGVLGGGYGKQRQLMKDQLAELQKQRQAEMDKKKIDDSAVEDYNKQIQEMQIAIREFAMEAAKDLYGIDLNGWAEQLGDSLVDAFAAGEDAAKAFDDTVGDIMRDVTKKMISQDILAPMFGDLRDYLFGTNGEGGAFGSDFKLTPDEVSKMKEYMDRIKNQGIPAAQELYDAINQATGGILDDSSAKSGPSAGIQSVTEDTADLLASYVNAIRASVAMNETRWERLLGESLPQMSVISQAQLDAQRQIAENTLRNAIAAESIMKSNDEIGRLLVRATQGGVKFYVK